MGILCWLHLPKKILPKFYRNSLHHYLMIIVKRSLKMYTVLKPQSLMST